MTCPNCGKATLFEYNSTGWATCALCRYTFELTPYLATLQHRLEQYSEHNSKLLRWHAENDTPMLFLEGQPYFLEHLMNGERVVVVDNVPYWVWL